MTIQATHVLLAVNGSLMRGLEFNPTLLAAGAVFVREITTAAVVSAVVDQRPLPGDGPRHQRRRGGGGRNLVGCRSRGWCSCSRKSRAGLTIGKVTLADGSVVLGVLGEPAICEGQKEITAFGGWRAYIITLTSQQP